MVNLGVTNRTDYLGKKPEIVVCSIFQLILFDTVKYS